MKKIKVEPPAHERICAIRARYYHEIGAFPGLSIAEITQLLIARGKNNIPE